MIGLRTHYDEFGKLTARENAILKEAYEHGFKDGDGTGSTRECSAILKQLLEIRFGPIDEEIEMRLNFVGDSDRVWIVKRVFNAKSVEEVFEGLYLSGYVRPGVDLMSL